MRLRALFPVSLDRKITVLFGGAVLLTIAATLAFPWVQMDALSDENLRIRAEGLAMLARQMILAPDSPKDWNEARNRLREKWPEFQRFYDTTVVMPALLSLEEVKASSGQTRAGFHAEAVAVLSEKVDQRSYYRLQDEGRRFRLAWAVRGLPADPNPQRLRGIVDVQLPVSTDARAWNSLVTILAGGSGAVLAIVVFYIVTQRLVLSPVNDLREVAERVTAEDLSVRADIRTGDEFERLAEAFNDMLEHISKNQEELQRINRSLDIKLGELAETNVNLYEANRMKSDFLANVSHELRTPLVSIIGFADLLKDAWELPEFDRTRLRRYTDNILTSSRMLLDLINDLLDLAKIEAGKLEVHVSTIDLSKVCEDLIDFVRPLADKKDLDLVLDVPADVPPMSSDSGKIKQVLYNLLSNAIKFTLPGGRVGLSAGMEDADHVVLTVTDTGPGIPPEQIDAIFEKFRQLDSSRTREYEGTGLGLTITRELVVILGGRISLKSAVGEGCEFRVVLPLTAPQAGA